MKRIMNFLVIGIGLVLFSSLMTSCSDTGEDTLDDITVENFVDRGVFGLQSIGKIGRMGCYEFVFPIDVELPDGSTVTVDDYSGLRVAIAEFIVEYQDTSGVRPMLVYPLEITNDEGEITTVTSPEEMKELRRACRKDFFDNIRNRGHRKGDRCFKLMFPVEVGFPDESVITADDKKALKMAIRTWKSENPDAEEKPSLVFPVTVEFKDGSVATLETKEGFQRLRETCSQN